MIAGHAAFGISETEGDELRRLPGLSGALWRLPWFPGICIHGRWMGRLHDSYSAYSVRFFRVGPQPPTSLPLDRVESKGFADAGQFHYLSRSGN